MHGVLTPPPDLPRHEIAYVFGQMSSPDSVPSLIEVLRRPDEEDMVRHEAAEALGGIATDDCLPILKEFANDPNCPRVVKESCEVALDMVSRHLIPPGPNGGADSARCGGAVRVRAVRLVPIRDPASFGCLSVYFRSPVCLGFPLPLPPPPFVATKRRRACIPYSFPG